MRVPSQLQSYGSKHCDCETCTGVQTQYMAGLKIKLYTSDNQLHLSASSQYTKSKQDNRQASEQRLAEWAINTKI
jgi:hypothetical protein